MSQLSLGRGRTTGVKPAIEPQVAARAEVRPEQVIADRGMFRLLSGSLVFIGALAIVLTIFMGFGSKDAGRQAVAAYHVGFLYCLGLALGCLGMQMIFQQFNAGWAAAVRRQAENVSSLIWVCAILFIPIAINAFIGAEGARLFKWMSPSYTAGDLLFEHKKAWLNQPFWLVRAGVYFTIWTLLALTLAKLSLRQDQTGDRWLTARARKISAFGLLLYALTTAFASFDWLMGLDYHWFSTMFGVYFFAGCIISATALCIIILATLVNCGKLKGLVTAEHFHDMGKLLFAFTVFWAYITFCQYFLIWYSNIPEETAFYNLRQKGGYEVLGVVISVGHFMLPFLILLFRGVKRNPRLLMLVAVWLLLMHALDVFYIVRPMIKSAPLGDRFLLDICGVVGPVLLFLGLVVRKVVSVPLMPLKDPRLHEAIHHKNYI